MKNLAEFVKPYECSLLLAVTSEADLRAKDAELPSDTYLVRYRIPGDDQEICSAFRAYKSVDIFDALFDAGYVVEEIRMGFGRIKPKLYQG